MAVYALVMNLIELILPAISGLGTRNINCEIYQIKTDITVLFDSSKLALLGCHVNEEGLQN